MQMYPNIEGKVKIRILSFKIPDSAEFPDECRGGTVEAGVWPPIGVMKHTLDEEGAVERLEDWIINNIFVGFIKEYPGYSEPELKEDRVLIRATSADGRILLDSFDWEEVRPDLDYSQ